MGWTDWLFLAHAGATLLMAGLAWFVQIVHYPLMTHVQPERFRTFEAAHTARTTIVVAPLMLIEALAAVLIVVASPPDVPVWTAWCGLALLSLVWGTTFGVLVPLHRRLQRGWDARSHAALVRWNLPRTIAWSLRGALALWMLTPGGGGA